MANKQNFTPVEWTKVLESGMLASMAVTAAEPSGLWGTLMETFAGGSAFAASKHDPSANDRRLRNSGRPGGGAGGPAQGLCRRQARQIARRALAHLREVSEILDAKAPGDAAAFKACLRGISQKVAEASKEGSFLGVGGVQVSDAEKATLADISKALGVSA